MYDKKNIILYLLMLLIPITYEMLRFVPHEPIVTPYTFSFAPTLYLQKIFGTSGPIAIFASYYYVIPHIILLFILGIEFFFTKQRPPWFYLSIVIIIYIVDSIITVVFPVAPPVRLAHPDYVPIRINIFPLSESTITSYYSALPSGHIFTTAYGALVALKEGWKKLYWIYTINTILMTVVIVYLGDHYFIDAVASVVLVLIIYKSFEAYTLKKKMIHK